MSEAQVLIRQALVSDATCRVGDVSAAGQPFVAAFQSSQPSGATVAFPRTWSQLEAVVETRLSEFEARHRRECEESFERGRLEGRREQVAELDARLAAAAEPWRALQAGVRRELATFREELYRDATELASALARAWLGTIVEIHPRVFEAGLRTALEALGHQEHVEARLHPQDYEAFRRGLDDRDLTLWEAPEVTVSPDPAVDRGGAIVTAKGGTADARLSVRVQKALEWLNLAHEPR